VKRAMKKRGSLFSFEGIDGCGKTTQINGIREDLLALGYRVELFREPGGTCLGEELRRIVLLNNGIPICERAEVLLYVASRTQLVHEKVFPLLEKGVIVLLDRYADSSVAYQGFGRLLPVEEIIGLNDFAIEKRYPGKTFFIDISVEEAEKRLSSKEKDRLEGEKEEFFHRVRHGYLTLAERYPGRFVILDGQQDPELLRKRILQAVLAEIDSPEKKDR